MLENLIVVGVSRTHREYVQEIGELLGQKEDMLDILLPHRFSSEEFCPRFLNNAAKGRNVYLVVPQGPFKNPQDLLTRILFCADAAKRNGARKITLIATELQYARQDRGPEEDIKMEGQPASTELVAKLFHTAGIDRVVAVHPHSPRIKQIYEKVYNQKGDDVFYDITPDFLLAHYFCSGKSSLAIENKGSNLVFVAVDKGSEQYVRSVRNYMNVPNSGMLIFEKTRKIPNKDTAVDITLAESSNVSSLEGKSVITPDDMWDTCGTIRADCNWINVVHAEFDHRLGRPKDMYLYATHPIFASEGHLTRQKELTKTGVMEYICTNTRPYIVREQDIDFQERSTVLCIEKLIADVICNCCEENIPPNKRYKTLSFQQISNLYTIHRSKRHFLEKN